MLPALPVLEFFEAMGLVVLILDFVLLYRLFYPGIVGAKAIALFITTVITFLLLIPYPWFAWLLFFVLFLYAFFGSFRPWDW
ncbi:hypothetical protein HY095_03310 [Candidatus Micrarchaeota archaeon]|nr:hypothetical protein [Candidatus Micrarchaeota archaeon]